ncbi:unnamed protein product [Rhizophagus irregularis]|uniref:Uncharacterized protein n=1 Tax=Rhizophagus irregularis TaxID=588596 RepID=A0A2I1F443_9GLOM|nr:hypothetical protein RhiirB3_445635 [Rhizophagus irregularis]CAB5380705.1 unnamed protein product [Rhizophagus irregularis]
MSSNDTPYNPAEETINSILTGLLPVLIFGLFNGFEDDKKKIISMINIFDDFVIFASITIYPLITAFEWYQYYTKFNKIMVIINYIFVAIFEIISYSCFLFIRYKSKIIGVKENENNKQKNEEKKKKIKEERNNETSISIVEESENKDNKGENNEDEKTRHMLNNEFLVIFFMVLTITSTIGYTTFIQGDLDKLNIKNFIYISNYCTKNFGVNKCKSLRITNNIVYYCSIGFHFLQLIYIKYYKRKRLLKLQKRENKILRWFTSVLKHINIIILIVYPAIVSGYLISTNPITTKIAFGICILSFTRLVNHFNEKPENVNTLISFYLNGHIYKDKKQIEKLTEDIEDLTKKLNDKIGELKELKKGDGKNKGRKIIY